MKKAFYKISNGLISYSNYKNFQTSSSKLSLAHSALNPIEDFCPEVEHDSRNKTVLIWSRHSYQERPDIIFQTLQEEDAFNNAYWEYRDKRWEDMPKVNMSLEDYNALVAKWEKIKKEKPEYVIFTLDDSQQLDKIDVIGKNQLSEQDFLDMEREHEEYLVWKEAKCLYNTDHEIVDDYWRSPADSIYDANITKYIGRKTGFIQHKKHTKTEALTEFKERLQNKEPIYLAVHWLRVRSDYNFEPLDKEKDAFLWDIGIMDTNPTMSRSYKELIEMTNRVLAGENIEIYPTD